MFIRKTLGATVGVLALGAVLAGCGGDDMPGTGQSSPTATAEQGEANQADITFAQQMIPHHQQAVEMAKLVPSRTSNQQVLDLAEQIEQAQDPEIETMTGWLKEWGAPAPTTGMDEDMDMGEDMDMSEDGMSGMMSAEDMKKLEQAKDAEFDRLWMQMMIKHHEGAIDMARTELKDGSNGDAKQLAQEVIDGQQAEIDTMEKLLGEG